MSAVEGKCLCGSQLTSSDNATLTIYASDGKSYSYRTCHNCGHMTMFPMPTVDVISSFYDAAYYGTGARKFPWFVDAVRGLCLAWRARTSARIVRHPADVLDVGCGDGRYLQAMRARGHRIYGTEMLGPAFDRAARIIGIELRPPPLTTDTFSTRRFALVTAWHVLEHLPAPDQLLHNIHALLNDDGKLIVEVPNTASWHGRLTGTAAFGLDPPRHLHQFTKHSLGAVLERNGFKVEKMETLSFEMGVMGFVQSLLNCCLRPRDLFYDALRSRGRCSGRLSLKVVSAMLAVPLIPVGIVWTIAESVAGHGAVLRATCRMVRQSRA